MPVRVMVDSNFYDALHADSEFKALVEKRQADGRLTILSTHVQETELAKIPQDRNVGQAQAVVAESVGASVFVLDYGMLDVDRFGTEESSDAYHRIHRGNNKNIEDAMIGATATTDADILVTNDKKFTSRFRELSGTVPVMNSVEFKDYLSSMTDY